MSHELFAAAHPNIQQHVNNSNYRQPKKSSSLLFPAYSYSGCGFSSTLSHLLRGLSSSVS